jgi:hypothetical protein
MAQSAKNFRASTNEREDLFVALLPQFKLYVEKMSAILSPDGGKRFVTGGGNGALIKAGVYRAGVILIIVATGKDSGDTHFGATGSLHLESGTGFRSRCRPGAG